MKRLLAVLCLLPGLLFAAFDYPIGEKAVYKIQWGLFTGGTSTISCDLVEVDSNALIRIRVRVQSNWLVSTLYPVDDTVDCFIDPETGLSIRLEKNTSEGDKICRDVLTLDRESNRAGWISTSDNISTNYPIEPGVCDAVSFLYLFRQTDLKQGESKDFKIVVDTAQHGITVTASDGKPKNKNVGAGQKVECREYRVTPGRDDLFVRKIPESIWLTNDDRKILARMDVHIPVGTARIVLDEYIPPAQ